MASYVLHHIAGNILLDKYKLSDEKKALFLMGNLIPDSGNRKEMEKSHFYRKEDFSLNFQKPHLEDFISKYGSLIDNPTVFGYYYHLFVEYCIFDMLYGNAFTCIDYFGIETDDWADTKKYKIKKNKTILSPEDFWSNNFFSGDAFSKINRVLLEYYGIEFDEAELRKFISLFKNPGIEEVDCSNIESIFSKFQSSINEAKSLRKFDLRVFDEDKVIKFIDDVVSKFSDENDALIHKFIKK